MVPAWEAAALEVVETGLPLEILIRAFRSPPLHHDADQLCVAVVSMIGTVVVFVVDGTTHVIARDKVAGISVQPNS